MLNMRASVSAFRVKKTSLKGNAVVDRGRFSGLLRCYAPRNDVDKKRHALSEKDGPSGLKR